MLVTLGQTTNFTYTYEDSLMDARRRAQALMTSCEGDFVKCQKLFGVTGGFGPSNRVTLRVDSPPDGAIGINYNYQTDGSMLIIMDPISGFYLENLADDRAHQIFIAEIAEVRMVYRA